MRRKIALAAIGAGLAASLLPVTSASAEPCTIVPKIYRSADAAAGGALPDRDWTCT